jgi:anti-anti-sigma factor
VRLEEITIGDGPGYGNFASAVPAFAFELEPEQLAEGICAIKIRGVLDRTRSPVFREVIDELIQEGNPIIVVDLEECTFIDSSGVADLVTMARRLLNLDGALVACEARDQAERLFEILGLSTLIPVFPSRLEALEALLPVSA